ncbi:hypothetical protein DXV76_16090 [Rhodobacteraceae bacterium CCMM004]|nr:hypothetical protein DXV76_16090 [Rhodobacteraceae bacterium CCMM004]
MMKYAIPLALALGAAPALAQEGPDLAAFAMDVCFFVDPTPAIPEETLTGAGFENTMHGDGKDEFARTEDGASLVYVAREDFASCELRLPQRDDAARDALAAELSAAIGERYDAIEAETLEDGQLWRVRPQGDLVSTTALVLEPETMDLVLTSAVQVGEPADPAAEDQPAQTDN